MQPIEWGGVRIDYLKQEENEKQTNTDDEDWLFDTELYDTPL